MKRPAIIALLLAVSLLLQAQNEPLIQPPRPKVGVVLGGGGAKGAAHIGVLKYLEEIGIPVDYVAGTSMGSIIGGFYAMGYSPDELKQLIAGMDWGEYIGNKIDRKMMSEDFRRRNSTTFLHVPFSMENPFDHRPHSPFISQLPSAFVNNSSLINLFNDLSVGYQEEMDFNDLPIPFACVATDMVEGREVVLRHGSVPTAMRASMAIPGVFSPVAMDNMMLVDGGLVNNFPADVLKEMGADIIIGVDVSSTKDVTVDDLKSLPQLFARLLTNSTSAKLLANRELCDIYIAPDIRGYGTLSFRPDAIDTLVNRGYKRASHFHDPLTAVKKAVEASAGHPVGKMLRAPHAKNFANDTLLIRSITVNNVSERESRWIARKGRLKAGERYVQADIERAMALFRGTGCFDEVTYHLAESDSARSGHRPSDAYDLNIDMKPAKPHVFGMGVRYDTEEGAAVLLNIGLNEKKFNGSKLNLTAKLSYNPKLNLTYTYSRPGLTNFNLSVDYRNEHFRTRGLDDKYVNLHYRQTKVNAYISEFHLLNFSTNVGVSYIYTNYGKTSLEESDLDERDFKDNTILAPFVKMQYDNLDDPYFAKQGIMVNLNSHYYYMPPTKEKFFDINYTFQAYITPAGGRFSIIPQVYGRYVGNIVGNAPQVQYHNLRNVGGGEIAGRHFDNQMPFIGLTSVEDMGEGHASILRLDLRYNFYGKHYLTAMYNTSVPWGMLGNGGSTFADVFSSMGHGAGLKYSYNSFLGPISLTGHWSRSYYARQHFGAYFSFGYTF